MEAIPHIPPPSKYGWHWWTNSSCNFQQHIHICTTRCHTYVQYICTANTYMYVYVSTEIHTQYTHTYLHTYIHRYIHRYIQYVCKIETEIHMQYIHTQYIRTNIRTYIHTYVHWYIHRYIQYACKICTYTRYMAQVVFVCLLSFTGKPGGSFTSTNCLNLWKCL